MKKRLLSLLLLCALFSSLAMSGLAADSQETAAPNQALLEAMLYGDRHWVIETLVEDDRTNNPMAVLTGVSGSDSMARDALNVFYGIDENGESYASAYRRMVMVMEKLYSAEEYMAGILDAGGELLAGLIGLFTNSEDARQTVDELTASTDEFRYENLLKSIFSAEYTGSDGTTLTERESSLIMVRQLRSALTYLDSLATVGRAQAESIVGSAEMAGFDAAYLEDYAVPYANAIRNYLRSIGQLAFPDDKKDVQRLADAAALLAVVSNLSMAEPEGSYLGFSYRDYLAETLTDAGVTEVLHAAGTALNIAGTAMDSYLYLNSIQGQKESISGGLSRLAASSEDEDLKKSLEYFAGTLSDEYDERLLSYDSIVTYLREHNTISQSVWSGSKALFQKLTHIGGTSLYTSAVSSALTISDTTAWVADQAVGLEDTCKKTYELLYLEDLIQLCVAQYQTDLAAYEAAPDEARAALVLDDLLLLQRMRLYGEKTAYSMGVAQTESWLISLFYGGAETAEAYETLYQNSVDILLAASVAPPMGGITMGPNDTLTVGFDARTGYYGTIIRGGELIYLPELSSRLAGGLALYHTLNIMGDSSVPLGIGYVQAVGDTALNLASGQICIQELEQSGGTLQITAAPGASLAVTGTFSVTDCAYTPSDGLPLPVHDLALNGDFRGGGLSVSGDVTASGGTTALLTLQSEEPQSVSGSLTCSVLQLLGDAVTVSDSGRITVTEEVFAPDTLVSGGKNILLSGGTVSGGTYHGDLSLKNASIPSFTFFGSLCDQGGTAYGGEVNVQGNLEVQAASSLPAGSALNVRQSAVLNGQALTGGGTLRLYGDLSVSGQCALSSVVLCGSAPQELAGALTADTLRIDNPSGVEVSGTVTVQTSLSHPGGGFVSGGPIILADNAALENSRFNGNLSVGAWTMDGPGSIGGDLTLRDGGLISGTALDVAGTLAVSGAAAVQGAAITAGQFDSQTSLTTDSPITVTGFAQCGQVLDSTSELRVLGDLVTDGLTCSGTIRLAGDLRANDTLSASALILDGTYRQELSGTIQVGTLLIQNTSSSGVVNSGSVSVSGRYENSGGAVKGNAIQVGTDGGYAFSSDAVLQGDHAVAGDMSLQNCTVTVNGTLTVSGSLRLENAALNVTGGLVLSKYNSALTVDARSSLAVTGTAALQDVTVTQDGSMTVGSDLFLQTAAFSGTGSLYLNGDLISNRAVTQGALICRGLVRQRLDASSIQVQELTLDNSAQGGVCLDCPVYCTGTAELGDTALFNPENLIEEGT